MKFLPTFVCTLCILLGLHATPSLADPSKPNPEALLLNIYQLQSEGEFEQALAAADLLIEQYPTFNLGHLVRGDLLISRTRPISTLGDTQAARQYFEKLADLRDEAKNRLRAMASPPSPNTVPNVLLNLSSEKKFALVVDTSKGRLYVFSNQDGLPRYLADYYISIGKAGTDKQSIGDLKTPLGVYRILEAIPGNKLTDFYGKGALTLNYPNTWDQQQGKTGYGIWLHGVPSANYSRAPQASNGCIALSNPDMETLLSKIEPGTNVVISKEIEWLDLSVWRAAREAFVNQFSRLSTGEKVPPWQSVSVFRYPNQKDVIQISYDRGSENTKRKNALRSSGNWQEQYWQFDGSSWRLIQKGSSS